MILCSPTERAAIRQPLDRLARAHAIDVEISALAERKGVDFAWHHNGRWWGVQRKELHDFLASLDDGRLTKEIAQMNAHVTMPIVALEGRIALTNDGMVMTKGYGRPITWSSLRRRMLTVQSRGIGVFQTDGHAGTAELIVDLYEWSMAEGHTTATTRPKPTADWGKLTNRDFQVHLLTSLPDVGRKTAEAIIDTLGRCPVRIDATVAELMTVPGIGRVMARKIVNTINEEAT